jgi:hypothetical protein
MPSYRIRRLSFAASAGLHGLAIVILGLMSTHNESAETTAYKQFIDPQTHKIVWYDFRKKLPDVAAVEKVGTFPTPRGAELSKQAIIATSKSARSNKQFIWRPVPKIEIPKDLLVPNLIARVNAVPPPPPPTTVRAAQQNNSPPQPKGDVSHAPKIVKIFVPPPRETRRPQSPASMPDAPMPDPSIVGSLKVKDSILALRSRRAFVLPPQATQPKHGAIPGSMPDTPLPDASVVGASKVKSSLPEGLGAPAVSTSYAPPSTAGTAEIPSAGNANVDIAIAGLHAAEKLNGALPDGSRPGRFSKAPIIGEAASGDVGGSGTLKVPDLTIREDQTGSAQAPEANGNRKTILYTETLRSLPVSTLSVPLRPSSRTIPSTIDARFQGRSVYTMVVPIENLPDYGGDWIIWFAERDQKPGEPSSMRAPIPFRKLEPVGAMPSRARIEWRLQIAAVIRQDGKLDGISLLRHSGPAAEQAVIHDLESWEFKPATRGGMPVDVDAVIEIPFILPGEVAKRTEP